MILTLGLISPHFTEAELAVTDDEHRALQDVPTADVRWRAKVLAYAVLEPLRYLVGPLRVTSWYRSAKLNAEVGGVADSGHRTGEAIDVVPMRPNGLYDAWHRLLTHPELQLDQAIIYEHDAHLHLAVNAVGTPRREFLVNVGPRRYVPWGSYDGPVRTAYERYLDQR